jgi:hypothetical protein
MVSGLPVAGILKAVELEDGILALIMSTLICFALKEEAALFRKIAAGVGMCRGHPVSNLLTGI